MPQMTMLNKLAEFHRLSDQRLREAGAEVCEDAWDDRNNRKHKLRRKLIREEVDELIEAMCFEDREAVAKELADVLYVVLPVAFIFDIPIQEVFNRVHDNNMLKLNNATIREDGKILKDPNHPKVVLGDLFET